MRACNNSECANPYPCPIHDHSGGVRDILDGLIDQVLMGFAAGFTKPRIKEICEKWLAKGDPHER